jgi:DNA-binding PadR family transcriptional regulator
MSKSDSQKKYFKTPKGKEALQRARRSYDEEDVERRRKQKREYMRRKRLENPNYCKWK